MTLRARASLILLTLAIAASTSAGVSAQRTVTTGPQNAPLTAAVPVDPRITVGTLPNGLRYYIRRNQQPQGRAELRLVVNAGSILEDDDQRGLAHFVEHMAFNGTRHFPKQEVHRLSAVDGRALRGAHQRQHELRSDGLPVADSHRRCQRHRPVAADHGRLGARRLVRSSRDRERARGHPRRVARGSGPRRPDAGRAASGPPQGLPLRRSAADRKARDHPDLLLRPPEEVLYRLVSAGSHGRDRRRRFRSVSDREDDQVALRRHPGCRIAAAAADLRRARSARHPIYRGHRQGGHGHHGQRIQPDGRPGSDDHRRLPAADDRAGVQRPAVGAPRGDDAEAGCAVPGCADQPRPLRALGRSDER